MFKNFWGYALGPCMRRRSGAVYLLASLVGRNYAIADTAIQGTRGPRRPKCVALKYQHVMVSRFTLFRNIAMELMEYLADDLANRGAHMLFSARVGKI